MFAEVDNDYLGNSLESKDPASTKRIIKRAVDTFLKFLGSNDCAFEAFPVDKLPNENWYL